MARSLEPEASLQRRLSGKAGQLAMKLSCESARIGDGQWQSCCETGKTTVALKVHITHNILNLLVELCNAIRWCQNHCSCAGLSACFWASGRLFASLGDQIIGSVRRSVDLYDTTAIWDGLGRTAVSWHGRVGWARLGVCLGLLRPDWQSRLQVSGNWRPLLPVH